MQPLRIPSAERGGIKLGLFGKLICRTTWLKIALVSRTFDFAYIMKEFGYYNDLFGPCRNEGDHCKLPKIIKRSFRNTTCSRVLREDFAPPCDINFKYGIENDGG